MDKILGDKKAIIAFVLPAFIVFAAIIILPMFISTYYSFFDWDGIGEMKFIGLQNYKTMFVGNSARSEGGFWQTLTSGRNVFLRSVGNTLILTTLTLVFQLPIAILLGIVLARGVKGEGAFRTIYFIPVMLSSVVIGHLFRRIYDTNFGLLNTFLTNIGLENWTRPWLGDMKTALFAAAVPIIWQWVGYHMLLVYAAAKSVPQDLMDAARIDGANALQTTFKVTLPLIAPVLKICTVMLIIGSFKEFDMIFTMTGGGPAHASEMPSTLMMSTLFNSYQYGYGSAMVVFILLECLLVTLLVERVFKTADVTY